MHELTPIQKEIISGLSAGSLTTLIVHPLDLIKVRLQLLATTTTQQHQKGYTYLINELINNSKKMGSQGPIYNLIKESYRGLPINLLGNAVAWSLYFTIYNSTKDYMFQNNYLHNNNTTIFLTSGLISGISTTLLTNPLWVIKTRIMSTSRHHKDSYKSIRHGFKSLLTKEGPKAIWMGLLPSLLGVSQGAIYFMIYDNLKLHFNVNLNKSKKDNANANLKIVLISSLSKMLSVMSVYPFQLLKSNLQTFRSVTNNIPQNDYHFITLIRKIYRDNGIKGLYKGLSANLLRAIPSTCITFCIYENFKSKL
ncbi:hypothetical protein NCAS_0B06590 [Naumovozyma castellii]|uniref:Mitochondrial FAD carrier protein FLX1 n=1 Tax=Naumovozyma castellii TaxID=27288 RepID=G0V9X6_NAUCA|nr:hypothetical protein NCAS_0B06590 [Naumovozyma castellii CBS 4309]CCC68743.1 hypothetical protein NCAS_0B06590 [Naumovozyma castellii CBS 4309]